MTSASTTPGNTFVNAVGMNYVSSTQNHTLLRRSDQWRRASGGTNEIWPAANGIYVASTASRRISNPTMLTTSAQFATGDRSQFALHIRNGRRHEPRHHQLRVNDAQTTPASSKLFYMPIAGGTPTQMSMPSGVTLDFATLPTTAAAIATSSTPARKFCTSRFKRQKRQRRRNHPHHPTRLGAPTGGQFYERRQQFLQARHQRSGKGLPPQAWRSMSYHCALQQASATTHATEQSTNISLATASSIPTSTAPNLAGFADADHKQYVSFFERNRERRSPHVQRHHQQDRERHRDRLQSFNLAPSETLTFTRQQRTTRITRPQLARCVTTRGWRQSDQLHPAATTRRAHFDLDRQRRRDRQQQAQNVATTTLTIDAVNDPAVSVGGQDGQLHRAGNGGGDRTDFDHDRSGQPQPQRRSRPPSVPDSSTAICSISPGRTALQRAATAPRSVLSADRRGPLVPATRPHCARSPVLRAATSLKPRCGYVAHDRLYVVNDGLLGATRPSTSTVNVTAVNESAGGLGQRNNRLHRTWRSRNADAAITASDVDNQTLADAMLRSPAACSPTARSTSPTRTASPAATTAPPALLGLTGTATLRAPPGALAS